MDGAHAFEVWISGAEHVRDLVWAPTMLAARRAFHVGTHLEHPDFALVRARRLAADEAAELYPDAPTAPTLACEVLLIRGRLLSERLRVLAVLTRARLTGGERRLITRRAAEINVLERAAADLYAAGYRAHQPLAEAFACLKGHPCTTPSPGPTQPGLPSSETSVSSASSSAPA